MTDKQSNALLAYMGYKSWLPDDRPAPASGSALDTSLTTGRTKNSEIVHVTNAAMKTIYGYRRSLCGVALQEMLWDTVHPNDLDCIDCNNCRKIALRDKQNTERSEPAPTSGSTTQN